MKRCRRFIGILSFIFAIAILFLLLPPRYTGLQKFVVLSGSMEPVYPTGSLLVVKSASQDNLAVGDVITFRWNESVVVTHRIVEILRDENDSESIWFRTKGDANRTEDPGMVSGESVIGTPVFSIPMIGYLIHYLQKF